MTAKPIFRRQRARFDLQKATDYYDREAGPDLALRFTDAVRDAFETVAQSPGIGSSLLGSWLDIRGLRGRPVARFPYLIFYVEHPTEIEVWRVLHAKSDLLRTLQQEFGELSP